MPYKIFFSRCPSVKWHVVWNHDKRDETSTTLQVKLSWGSVHGSAQKESTLSGNFFLQTQFLYVSWTVHFMIKRLKPKLLETGRFAWWATASGATDEYRAARVIISYFENLKTTELANSTLKQQFKKTTNFKRLWYCSPPINWYNDNTLFAYACYFFLTVTFSRICYVNLFTHVLRV